MPLLIKTITVILAGAFFAALTMTARSGAHLQRTGYPHNDHPVSRHKRWGFCAGVLMAATILFIERVVVPYFGRQDNPLFWVHLVAAVSCSVFFILAAVFNGRRLEGRPALHRAFGKLAWYCGIGALVLGTIATIRLRP